MDRSDRRFAVLGRGREREPTVGKERAADPLCALGDLVGGHAHAHERLRVDIVGQVDRRVDDLHRNLVRRCLPVA
ncbi:MAG: hypothetical protein WKF78_12975 [Candidatus Limnocylindrales bacterium]